MIQKPSNMNEYLDDLCDSIDAAMFSGDVFFEKDAHDEMTKYLERWTKQMADIKDIAYAVNENNCGHVKVGDKLVSVTSSGDLIPGVQYEVIDITEEDCETTLWITKNGRKVKALPESFRFPY